MIHVTRPLRSADHQGDPADLAKQISLSLDATAPLADGRRVRLRYPQAADRAQIIDLLGRVGLSADEVDLARALRFDPRERVVVCATTWDGSAEIVVAFASRMRDPGDALTVVADEQRAPGVGALLRRKLAGNARIAA